MADKMAGKMAGKVATSVAVIQLAFLASKLNPNFHPHSVAPVVIFPFARASVYDYR